MRKRFILGILVLALFLLIYFLRNSGPALFLTSSLQNLFAPVKSALYASRMGPNEAQEPLRKQNRELLIKLSEYENIKKDNVALRSQFENSPTNPQNLLVARVVGYKGRADFPHTLIIDKGEEDELKVGMAVVVEKNLVGKISEIQGNFSQIMLIDNGGFSTLGKTAESAGVVRGADDFILYDKVVITDKLKKNELVLTKGQVNEKGVGIMPDLVVGKVISIEKRDNKPFQSAQIKSLLDFSKLTLVFIVKN